MANRAQAARRGRALLFLISLVLLQVHASSTALLELLHSPAVASLRTLDLEVAGGVERGVVAKLASQGCLPWLRTLTVKLKSKQDVKLLLEAPGLRRVTRLRLSGLAEDRELERQIADRFRPRL